MSDQSQQFVHLPQDPEWTRWDLARDLVVFQLKLALDGVRDLLLSPISILVGVGGLLTGGDNPGPQFYELLRWGHKTDRWIGLFSAADDKFASSLPVRREEHTADVIVSRMEKMVKGRYLANRPRSSERQSGDE